jgi:hypothetical protein
MEKNWKNDMYGGNILDPVINSVHRKESANKNSKELIEIKNYLERNIDSHAKNPKFTEQLFRLTDIYVHEQEDHAFFCDIWLLSSLKLQPHIIHYLKSLQKKSLLNEKNDLYKDSVYHMFKNGTYNSNFVRLEQVEQVITGYARVMCYQVYGYDEATGSYNPYIDF